MPAGVRDPVLGRLAGLSDDGRAVVRAAAVLQAPVEVPLLAATSRLPPGRLSQALEEAQIFINYMCRPEIQAKLSRKVGTAPTVRRDLLDLTPEEFAAVASDIPPIIPRYDLYATKSDWLNQKWTELIAG